MHFDAAIPLIIIFSCMFHKEYEGTLPDAATAVTRRSKRDGRMLWAQEQRDPSMACGNWTCWSTNAYNEHWTLNIHTDTTYEYTSFRCGIKTCSEIYLYLYIWGILKWCSCSRNLTIVVCSRTFSFVFLYLLLAEQTLCHVNDHVFPYR